MAQGVAAAEALPTIQLSINGHKIIAEVAATPERRALGLMHRFSLQPDHGMMFVFERPERQGFWMKKVHSAFRSRSSRPTAASSTRTRCRPARRKHAPSRRPALYIDEMRKGWFTEREHHRPAIVVKGLPEPKR